MRIKLPKKVLSASVSLAALLALGSATLAHADEYKMPRLLAIGTSGTSSGSFASTNGWGPVFQKETGSNVRIVPVDNESQRYQRLTDRRDLRISSVSSAEMRFQIEGIGSYAGSKPVAQRVIWHHNDTPWGFVVAGNSDLQTMEDLKKRKITVSQGEFSPPMVVAVTKALPAYLGMTEQETSENFSFVSASSYAQSCRAVVEGRADVAYCAPTSSILSEMEGAPGGIRWLNMDLDNKEAWDRFLTHRTMVVPTEIDLGVSTAKGVDGLASNFLYAVPADADEAFAYNMAKWFHQSFDKYKNTHPLSARMELSIFREYLDRSPLPVHEGTIRYLKEVGAWTAEDDKWNQAAVEKMDLWIKARQAALAEAAEGRVQASHNNPEFMAIVQKHTKGLEPFRTRL